MLLPPPDTTRPFPLVANGSIAKTSPSFGLVLLCVFETLGTDIPE